MDIIADKNVQVCKTVLGNLKSELGVMQTHGGGGPSDHSPILLLGQLGQQRFYTSLLVVTTAIINNKICKMNLFSFLM